MVWEIWGLKYVWGEGRFRTERVPTRAEYHGQRPEGAWCRSPPSPCPPPPPSPQRHCSTCRSPFCPEVCATCSGLFPLLQEALPLSSVALLSVSSLPIFWAPFLSGTFRNVPAYDSHHPDKEMLFSLTSRATISTPLHTNDRTASRTSCQEPTRDIPVVEQVVSITWCRNGDLPPWGTSHCEAAQGKRALEERIYRTWALVRRFGGGFKGARLCSGLDAVRKRGNSVTGYLKSHLPGRCTRPKLKL